jgi:hypothetical protein
MGNVNGSLVILLLSMLPDLDRQLLKDCPLPFPDTNCVFATNPNMRHAPNKIFLIFGEAHTLEDRHAVLGGRIGRVSDQVLCLPEVALGLIVDLGLVEHKKIVTLTLVLISGRRKKGVSLRRKKLTHNICVLKQETIQYPNIR